MLFRKIDPPLRHLIEDETIEILDRNGNPHEYRARIWKGAGVTPVALVTRDHAKERVSPGLMSSKIANHVTECMLCHSEYGYLHFEYDEGELDQVYFCYYGHAKRLRLFKPERKSVSLERFEELTGHKISE